MTDIQNQIGVADPFGVIAGWKAQLQVYPPRLKRAILTKRLAHVKYWRTDYHYRHKWE